MLSLTSPSDTLYNVYTLVHLIVFHKSLKLSSLFSLSLFFFFGSSNWMTALSLSSLILYSVLPSLLLNLSIEFLLLFSCAVVSDSLQSHRMQHTRPLCPSPSAKVCPSSCPLHWQSHPAISSSNALFSFCLQSFPASGTFPMSQLFTSGYQNTEVSTSASVLSTIHS